MGPNPAAHLVGCSFHVQAIQNGRRWLVRHTAWQLLSDLRLSGTEQPIMRIEDRLFDRGWVRSAMATRKCGNIYFRKYFRAVRKFTNIFVLLLIILKVGSCSMHYPSMASHKKSYGPTDRGCSQISTVRR